MPNQVNHEQCMKRWFTVSSSHICKTHLLAKYQPLFLRWSKVRILSKKVVHIKKKKKNLYGLQMLLWGNKSSVESMRLLYNDFIDNLPLQFKLHTQESLTPWTGQTPTKLHRSLANSLNSQSLRFLLKQGTQPSPPPNSKLRWSNRRIFFGVSYPFRRIINAVLSKTYDWLSSSPNANGPTYRSWIFDWEAYISRDYGRLLHFSFFLLLFFVAILASLMLVFVFLISLIKFLCLFQKKKSTLSNFIKFKIYSIQSFF